MKLTKPFRALIAMIFVGTMALAGCAAADSGPEHPDQPKNGMSFSVSYHADDRTPDKLTADVSVVLNASPKKLQELSGDKKLTPKAFMNQMKSSISQAAPDNGKDVKVINHGKNEAEMVAKGLSGENMSQVTSVTVELDDDHHYTFMADPRLIVQDPENRLPMTLAVTMPVDIDEANAGGKVDGATVSWNSTELLKQAEANQDLTALQGKTTQAHVLDSTPIWLSVVIFVLGLIVVVLMVALAIIPSDKARKNSAPAAEDDGTVATA